MKSLLFSPRRISPAENFFAENISVNNVRFVGEIFRDEIERNQASKLYCNEEFLVNEYNFKVHYEALQAESKSGDDSTNNFSHLAYL
jgi:hypothetical protein